LKPEKLCSKSFYSKLCHKTAGKMQFVLEQVWWLSKVDQKLVELKLLVQRMVG
jgi:hypothetical protein